MTNSFWIELGHYFKLFSTQVTVVPILGLMLFTLGYVWVKRKTHYNHPIYFLAFILAVCVDLPLSTWDSTSQGVGLHISGIGIVVVWIWGVYGRKRWPISFPVLASLYCFHYLFIDCLCSYHPMLAGFKQGEKTLNEVMALCNPQYWFWGVGACGLKDGLFVSFAFVLIHGRLFWKCCNSEQNHEPVVSLSPALSH